jgi:multidrug resistance efflux pump
MEFRMAESPSNHHLPINESPSHSETIQNLEEMLQHDTIAAPTSSTLIPVADPEPKNNANQQRQMLFRSIRLCLCIGVLTGVAWAIVRQQTTITSQQGFINGTIVSIPAPIAGNVQLASLKPGSPIQLGQSLGRVQNDRNPQWEIEHQRLQNKLDGLKVKLQSVKTKQSDRADRLAQFQRDRSQQGNLSVAADDSRIDRIQIEIDQAQQAVTIAQREADRLQQLVESGAIARMQLDKARDEVSAAKLRVEAKQTELAQASTEQTAAQQGLQLDGSQNLNYAETRSRDLEDEIADLARDRTAINAEINQTNQELLTLNQQLQLQKTARVAAPVSGVIWAMQNQIGTGNTVASHEALIQVLDCQQTWVDTFVSERELPHLRIGDPVSMTLLGQRDQKLTGRIQAIRAGVGRVAPGADVAVPPPQQSQRQVGVQIAWQTNPAITQQSAQFCGVGQSVEVAFPKSTNNSTLAHKPWSPQFWLSQVHDRFSRF